jgi:hypothetical protein
MLPPRLRRKPVGRLQDRSATPGSTDCACLGKACSGFVQVLPGATSRRDVTQQLSETFPSDYDPLTGQTFHSSPQDEIPDASERLATLIAAPPTSR